MPTQFELIRWMMRLGFRLRIPAATVRKLVPSRLTGTVEGFRFELHPKQNFTEWMMIVLGKFPERRSIDFLRNLMRGQDCHFVDIGANCGSFSIALAAVASPNSQVIAVEANPRMVERLEKNIALNALQSSITIRPVAVSDGVGEVELHLDTKNLGQSSIKPDHKRVSQDVIKVPSVPLVELMDENSPDRLFVVKMDIEGAEDLVLLSHMQTGDRLPDFLMLETTHADAWNVDLLRELSSVGFKSVFHGEGNTCFALRQRKNSVSGDGVQE